MVITQEIKKVISATTPNKRSKCDKAKKGTDLFPPFSDTCHSEIDEKTNKTNNCCTTLAITNGNDCIGRAKHPT